ncbi:lipase family protein [Vibrio caribbeanicus]|uniref:lipase family protein n=1 Tax=Vibrio caribbeanicus TaxID=701175 RepID=UPI002284F677|nr:lipase family protein [Vibrio caribbeanicus]MCY9846394.1 lipase family protein [Vibrio caribbeanicus]
MGTLNNVSTDLDKKTTLLELDLPSYRQAYSDRTAWLMAAFSELAYIRFNPALPSKLQKIGLDEALKRLIDQSTTSNTLKVISIIEGLLWNHEEEKTQLINELSTLNESKLVQTFDTELGTQAILVETPSSYVLAFRGTEATSLNDIKADAKATTIKCRTSGKIHEGFHEAFESVQEKLNAALKELDKSKPLFITGHSLGGALATIAAKRLKFKYGIAACYTFGAPRVGDKEWIATIKTPIYRIVNAADSVTMLPPNGVTIGVLSAGVGFIPWIGSKAKKFLLEKFSGYIHGGNMRYLTNCKKGEYEDVQLLYSVSFLFRLKAVLIGKLPYKKFLSDHSISIYRKKLEIVALKRNQGF